MGLKLNIRTEPLYEGTADFRPSIGIVTSFEMRSLFVVICTFVASTNILSVTHLWTAAFWRGSVKIRRIAGWSTGILDGAA